nr:hypothetical protein [Pseudomonas sp.]
MISSVDQRKVTSGRAMLSLFLYLHLMCKISVRTLIEIEQGVGNPTLKSLNAVFKPFGLQMGMVKRPSRFR